MFPLALNFRQRIFAFVFVYLFMLLTLGVLQESDCLHLTDTHISVTLLWDVETNKSNAQLECKYALDDDDNSLYTINWYRNGREFYRFGPHDSPPANTFRVYGVNVDISRSNASVVFLKSINQSTSGSYRCSAYSEPSYTHIFQETEVNIQACTSDAHGQPTTVDHFC